MNIETYKAITNAQRLAREELLKTDLTWVDLIHAGLIVEAISKYRNIYNCSLSNAKAEVDKYRNGGKFVNKTGF